MSQHLYGIHDPGGEYLFGDKSGWVVHTIDVRSDERIYYTDQQARVATPIVRLNWSHHGDGTIPPNPNDWDRFAWLCANYAKGCLNVTWLTIGNEPNLRVEWGRDEPITPEQYAACYRLVYDAIKAAVPGVLIAPAAIGPWNIDSGIDWIEYFKRMLAAIGPERVDWINLHTYSRGYEPRSVTDNTRMDAPYSAYFNGFRAYLDFLAAVPAELRHLPVHITEANGNGPWPDANTGWVQAAYAEIDRNNRLTGTQKIHSLCLFRWPKFDHQWQFETKNGVHEDFRQAVAKGYRVPELVDENLPNPIHKPNSVSQDIHKTYVPHVAGGAPQPVPPREWDDRLTKRKVQLVEHQPQPGEIYWRLVKAEYLEEKEHIFVNTLDEQGRPLPGVVVACSNGGEVGRATEDKFNDPYALGMVNFPMFAAGWAYSVQVASHPSDTVIGMGLGTYDEPTVGHHISYRLTFQRVQAKTQSDAIKPSNPQPEPVAEKPKQDAINPQLKWQRCIAFVRKWEGGWADNPNDPGGATMKGITLDTYTRWRQAHGQPAPSKADLRAIPDAEVDQIYFEWYWVASGADKMPWPMCLAQMDTAVNAGVGRAQQMHAKSEGNFLAYMGHLIDWYTRIENFEHFGKAWIRRRADLLLEASRA